MKKLYTLSTTFLLLLLFFNGMGQPNPEWTKTYNGPAGLGDRPRALCIDNNNNIYVTGPSDASRKGNLDYATIKYNAAGIQQWVARYNGEGNGEDWPYAITVDGNGNIYVTGRSMGAGKKANLNYATVKYNQDGQQQGVAIYRGTLNDVAMDVKADDLGNVYVTGFTKGPYALGGEAITTIKYEYVSPTNQLSQKWAVDYDMAPNDGNGANQEEGNSLALDESGNVYVTGRTVGNKRITIKYDNNGVQKWVYQVNGGEDRKVMIDGDGNILLTGFSGSTTKLDTEGNVIWVTSYPDAGFWDLALDGSNNVYVTGLVSINGHSQYKTVKYNSAGVEQWAKNYYGDANSPNFARNIAVGPTGNVYVTGQANILNGSSTIAKTVTVKYDANGDQQWVANAATGSGGFGIEVDNNDNIYVTGELSKSTSDMDFITLKYPAGVSPTSKPITSVQLNETNQPNFNLVSYPNPFYHSTTIQYKLPNDGKIRLSVIDLLGNEVITLVNEAKLAGVYTVNFKKDKLPAGTYLYRIQVGEYIETKKLVILK